VHATPQSHPDGDPADPARSGADIAEAVEVAERGTAVQEVHTPPGAPGTAPVEQAQGDPAMTGGTGGPDEDEHPPAGNPDPSRAGSGGAQSIVGARASDRVAAAEPLPDGPPYDPS
jgi:hypothetical protein